MHYVATIENSFRFKSNSLKFTKYDASLTNFFQTLEKQTIATRLIIGELTVIFSQLSIILLVVQTQLGLSRVPDSFGNGKSQWLANLEYRFLFSDAFSLLFFVDIGWASSLIVLKMLK